MAFWIPELLNMTVVIFDYGHISIPTTLNRGDSMLLREKKKTETKNKIFEAAGKLFKEKGIESVTVEDITREAGIAKGTFFNYFPTKTALLLYFGELKEKLTCDLVKNEAVRDIPTKEKTKNILILLAKSNEKERDLTKLFVFEYIRTYGLRSGEDKRRSHRLSKVLYTLLEDGMKRGEVRDSTDLKRAAENLTAIYFHSLMEWLWSDTDYSFSEDISEKTDMIFSGIGS